MPLTSLDFLRPKAPWPPLSERHRLQEYEDNKKLFERKHGEVFKNWNKIMREDIKTAVLIVLNWHKRLSLLWSDLLLGEPPRFRVGKDPESAQQIALDQMIRTTNLIQTTYGVVIDISRFGTGIFKVRLEDGQVRIEGQPPNIWFPVVAPDNVKRTTHQVLAFVLWADGRPYLKAEIHERGRITHRIFELKMDTDGFSIVREVNLNTIPGFEEIQAIQETSVNDFLVFPVAGVVTTDSPDGLGPDDYSDIDPIIQELMIRFSQISRILDKHSDPNLAGPDHAPSEDEETGEEIFLAGGKYFPLSPGDTPPQYVTWDGQLQAAYSEIAELMKQLYAISETSPAAFGQLEHGLAESGSALRRLMMAPLAKVNRIRLNLDPTLERVLSVASQLQGGGVAFEPQDLTIEWKDGLPEDQTESINNEVAAVGSKLTSRESAIRRLWGLEGKALQEELDRIDKEAKADAGLVAPPGERPSPQLEPNGENEEGEGSEE